MALMLFLSIRLIGFVCLRRNKVKNKISGAKDKVRKGLSDFGFQLFVSYFKFVTGVVISNC